MTDHGDYYVYALVDPRNGEIFYIGKGRRYRRNCHRREASRFGPKNGRLSRLCAIAEAGLEVHIREFASGLDEDDALTLERSLIARHRKHLTNIKAGGEPRSQDAKRKALVRWANKCLHDPRYISSTAALQKLIADPLRHGFTVYDNGKLLL